MPVIESDFVGFQYSLSLEPSVQINAMLAFSIKAKRYLYVYFVFSQALKNSKFFG